MGIQIVLRRLKKNATHKLERETGIEPASLAWKARVLPLNYSRTFLCVDAGTASSNSSTKNWWRGLDSNQCRRKPTDLQSAPFSHSGTPPKNSIVAAFLRSKTNLLFFSLCFVLSYKTGAAGGDRTHDPWLRRPILYPLSYSRPGPKSKASGIVARLCVKFPEAGNDP